MSSLLPKPVIHRYGQQHGSPGLGRIVRPRPSASVAGGGDSYSLGYSARAAARAADLANHLIRRDLRTHSLPARTLVDLLECCSVVRNNWRRYAALCGQHPASMTDALGPPAGRRLSSLG
jgi:hypothetical protein